MAEPAEPFAQSGARRLMIFGHPAHELAIFGLLQRHPPDAILILTDGGGPRREQHSKDGLAAIGLLDRTEFLHFPENDFYEALLDRRTGLFAEVVALIREHIDRARPDQVFCDAVEFYNPVHDITLPMVRAALNGRADVSLYEVPLVYQEPSPEPRYHIQRVPPSLADRRLRYQLSGEETARKVHARDTVYENLREQAGPEFMELPPEHLGVEEIFSAGDSIPRPESGDRVLRYEERARQLKTEGAIDRMITFEDHFLPVVRLLAQHGL